MAGIFTELRRRNVFKVSVAYIITGWILVEAADVLLDGFEAPGWVFKAFAALIFLGFPVAVIFAWAFELTPGGLIREKDVDRSQSITPRTGRKLDFIIIGLLVVALGYFVVTHDWDTQEIGRSATANGRQSIAVLPFTNRSALEEDVFFVDGVHDDLLTLLSKLGGLKVISRTSMEKFRGADLSIPEVAESLDVATVLEGAVQRAGGQVRINVQLIDADTDEHLWAETLDHEEAYIALIRTRDFSPALYDHALAVSTLAVLLGRAVGLEETDLQHLASAGLLHDAGLIKIPESVHRPLQQLSESQLGIYQSHPKRGLDLLTKQSSLPAEVQTLIGEHHVTLDGSGYPSKIDPTSIQTPSRILRLVDEYDELLSGHHTSTPQTVRVALQSLYQQGKKGMLDSELVAKFINLIGIYPTYSLVELSTGERGIVTGNSRENLLRPTILLIQDAKHQPLPEPIPFNFSVLSADTPPPEIVQVLPPEQVGVQLDSVLENWITL